MTVRIIPKLLVAEIETRSGLRSAIVRTKNFHERTVVGSLDSQARILEAAYADEFLLVFIDCQIQKDFNGVLREVSNLRDKIAVPLTIGGSIDSVGVASALFRAGADRVCIGHEALRNPSLVADIAARYGNQAVLASVDFQAGRRNATGIPIRLRTGVTINELEFQSLLGTLVGNGAGQIHLHDMTRDGSGAGLDIHFFRDLALEQLGIPVVLSGGCGVAEDFVQAFIELSVSGIAASTYFARRDQNPIQVRAHASNGGIDVRPVLNRRQRI